MAWIPFHVPPVQSASERSLLVKTLQIDRTNEALSETVLPNEGGQQTSETLLPLVRERPTLGVIADADDAAALESVLAMRINRGLSRRIATVDDDFLSASTAVLDGLDQLVLISDRLSRDVMAMSAVRHWLNRGGRLWVMLDQVSETTLRMLLDDASELAIVGHASLTNCVIRPDRPGILDAKGLELQFEEPIEFVRIMAPQGAVLQSIDDWPAAVLLKRGKGTILITTLAARGWVRSRTSADFIRSDPHNEVSLVAHAALEDLAHHFSRAIDKPILPREALASYVLSHVGYQVVDRSTISLLFVGYWLVWATIAVSLSWYRQQQHLIWCGPILSLTVSSVLLWIGFSSRRSVPDTFSTAQLIDIVPGSADLEVSGLLGVFRQNDLSSEPGSRAGGLYVSADAENSGSVHRMVWTDCDQWRMERTSPRSGLSLAPFHFSGQLAEPVTAQATFGPNGIEGRISSGPLKNLANAIVAMPGRGGLKLRLSSDGGFTAGRDDAIESGAYLTDLVSTDEQFRRQAVYQAMFGREPRFEFPGETTVFAWADPLDLNWNLSPNMTARGAALLALPLSYTPPTPGTRFSIPSALINYDSVGPTGAFDNSSRQWGQLSFPQTTCLRFQVPRGVLPVRIDRAEMVISVSAPFRCLEITNGRGAEPAVLARFGSPIGAFRFSSDDHELLQLDEAGGLRFGINVRDLRESSTNSSSPVFWKIRQIELELSGVGLPPTAD